MKPTPEHKAEARNLYSSYGHNPRNLYFACRDGQALSDDQFDKAQLQTTDYFMSNYWVQLVYAEFPPTLMASVPAYRDAFARVDTGAGLSALMFQYSMDERHIKVLMEEQGDTPKEVIAKLGVPKCEQLLPQMDTLYYKIKLAEDKEKLRLLRLEQNPRVGRNIEYTHAEIRRSDYALVRLYAQKNNLRVAEVFSKLLEHIQ